MLNPFFCFLGPPEDVVCGDLTSRPITSSTSNHLSFAGSLLWPVHQIPKSQDIIFQRALHAWLIRYNLTSEAAALLRGSNWSDVDIPQSD